MPATQASQAFGLSHCMMAPYSIDGAWADSLACTCPLSAASLNAMYNRKATPAHCTTCVSAGHCCNSSCRPNPISTNSKTNPSVAPAT
ncbi:hypothetical protein D3C71_1607380 [compost metagenome]